MSPGKYRRLQLPIHMHNRNMFCQPIKIQSFDNQSSKLTHHFGSILAPLRKHLRGSKVSNAYGILSLQFLKSEWMIGNKLRNFCQISTVIFYNMQEN